MVVSRVHDPGPGKLSADGAESESFDPHRATEPPRYSNQLNSSLLLFFFFFF